MASGRSSVGARARDRFVAFNDRLRRNLRVLASTGLAAALLAGSGATLAAASTALPGDALYPVKLFRESAQLAFASGASEGLKRLQFARTRLHEIQGLELRGSRNSDLYIATLDRMDSLTQTGSTLLIEAVRHGAKPAILRNIGGFASVQQQDLQALFPSMPAGALPAARASLVVLQLVTRTVDNVLSGCPCNPPSNPLIPQAAGPSTSSTQAVSCSCQQTSGSASSVTGGDQSSNPSGGGGSGSNQPKTPGQTPQTNPTTPADQLPDIPGTNADNQVKDLVDQLLTTPLPSPLPSVTLPPLLPSSPSSLPSIP